MQFPIELETQIQELASRYGEPQRVVVELPDGSFDPLEKTDRIGEVCMVLRRKSGGILTFRKDIYPKGVMRLLTGGINIGEPIETALFREVAEETSLTVQVNRFLAAIAYRSTQSAADSFDFFTFAFLLDEQSGELIVQDPEERVELFAEVAPADLYALADTLEQIESEIDREIGGNWRSWGIFRAASHRIIADILA